jgi:molybdate transport system substrate-binding protein
MSLKTCKSLAVTLIAASVLIGGPAKAASTINVAVAANFAGAMTALIAQFKAAYPSKGYNVTFTADSSGTLLTQIQSKSVAYDLFLSADATRPNLLTTSSFTTSLNPPGGCVPSATKGCGTGSPVLYAVGTLELWSPTVATVANGLSTTVPFNPPIVIADPTKAPYGYAAQQVLAYTPWSFPRNTALKTSCADPNTGTANPNCLVQDPANGLFTQANISLTYSAVKSGAYKSGFVAQSQICKANTSGVKTFTGFHKTYDAAGPYVNGPIKQWGIPLTSYASGTELLDFLNFLKSTAGQTIIKSYCYSLS